MYTKIMYARRIARDVLPKAAAELERWRRCSANIPNPELQRQARASMAKKRFHAEGGSVYASLTPRWLDTLVPLIVALQTISDYLDNLCDRSVSLDEADFRTLHLAMLDAVDSSEGSPDSARYYAIHPNKDDGGYLTALVNECRRRTAELPAYGVVRPHVRRLVSLYNDLQVYKHGPRDGRVPRLEKWFAEKGRPWSDLYWWEFAAAAGSTLGVFALFAAATHADLTPADADRIVQAYFPWICGLHILLDYLIDQEEDLAGGDLNLVSFYPNRDTMRRRLVLFVQEARRRARTLPHPAFHTTIVQGLPGLYLSDRKVPRQRMQRLALTLLRAGGPASFGYFLWCRWRRVIDPLYE